MALTGVYISLLLQDTTHVQPQTWLIFIAVLGAVALVAYLGVRTSSAADLVLAAGEVAVFAALAITILVKVGPAHYSIAAFSPASSPHGKFAAIGSGMIYGITAFAGFNVVIRFLFAMGRERVLPGALAKISRRHTPVVAIGSVAVMTLFLGLPLTYLYGGVHTFGYLAGVAGLSVVLIYLAVNIATIRAFRGEFRGDFRPGRHLVVPAIAALLLLFPLWGIIHPRTHMLVDLLPFAAFAWLGLGVLMVGALKARSSTGLGALGRAFRPAADDSTSAEELTQIAVASAGEEV
jgi:amino acid transporter